MIGLLKSGTEGEGDTKPVTTAEQICQRKRDLRRVLPSLAVITIESHIAMWTNEFKNRPLQSRPFNDKWLQNERDKVAKCVSFWEPLVTRVVVEEAPNISRA